VAGKWRDLSHFLLLPGLGTIDCPFSTELNLFLGFGYIPEGLKNKKQRTTKKS
jgi:hypothetical protein